MAASARKSPSRPVELSSWLGSDAAIRAPHLPPQRHEQTRSTVRRALDQKRYAVLQRLYAREGRLVDTQRHPARVERVEHARFVEHSTTAAGPFLLFGNQNSRFLFYTSSTEADGLLGSFAKGCQTKAEEQRQHDPEGDATQLFGRHIPKTGDAVSRPQAHREAGQPQRPIEIGAWLNEKRSAVEQKTGQGECSQRDHKSTSRLKKVRALIHQVTVRRMFACDQFQTFLPAPNCGMPDDRCANLQGDPSVLPS